MPEWKDFFFHIPSSHSLYSLYIYMFYFFPASVTNSNVNYREYTFPLS